MGIYNIANKAIFLDRDGVLNKSIVKGGKPYSPYLIEDIVIPEGVKPGLLKLKKRDFLLIMITNQPDISRGKLTLNSLNKINNFLSKELLLDDVFSCIHDDKDNCLCRKPKTGMITDAILKWKIDVNRSFLVGDRWKDIEAGKRMNLKTILINHNYKEKKTEPDYEFTSFLEVTNQILKLSK